MIFGEFIAPGQARVSVVVSNGEGDSIEASAVVDTGFMGALLLTRSLASRLNLPQIEQEELMLADGSIVRFAVHEAVVTWQDEERAVAAHVSDGDVLVGIELLLGNVGLIQFQEGGEVTIEAIE